ncbi:hypothetical protein J3E69DRAFT_329925 [Trichoderma sp. SZMC 28015]
MSRLPRVLFIMCLVQLQLLASSFTRMEAPNVPGSKVHVPTCMLRRVTCPLGGNKSVAPCTTLSWGDFAWGPFCRLLCGVAQRRITCISFTLTATLL